MEKRKERDSNIELLRCLLMFMIVVLHFVAHNILGRDNPATISDSNFVSANLLMAFCVCAVNCFVLISGFYGIRFSIKKLVLFFLPILFYEVAMSLIWYPYRHHLSLTPLNYWFVRPYVALMVLSPLLNKGLEMMAKRHLQWLIMLMIIIFLLPYNSISGNEGKNVLTFIILYVTGYYMSHHLKFKFCGWWGYFILYVLCNFAIFAEAYILARSGMGYEGLMHAYYYDSILVFISSILLFLVFKNLHLKSKFVNWVASSSFFVYIISENENMYKRPWSFYELLGVDEWPSSNHYVIYVLVSSLVVFVACIVIDKIRVMLFGRFERKVGEYVNTYLKY